MNDAPSALARVDALRYLCGSLSGAVDLRALAGGKVLARLLPDSDDDATILALGAADGGSLGAALASTGALWFWNLALKKPKLLARHDRVEGPILAADPGSTLVVTAGPDTIQVWKSGLPARSLPGAGPVSGVLEPREALAVFVRPGILAAGGEGLDVWDAATSRHLGRWSSPVTCLATGGGTLLAGDAKGGVWVVAGGD